MRDRWLTFGLSAAGMVFGYALASARIPTAYAVQALAGTAGNFESIRTKQFEFLDASGRAVIKMAISAEGTPAIWFFDKNGKDRLTVGLYGDGNSFFVMNDEKDQAVGIFRTIGTQVSPVLVMKANGHDRMVQGLNWNLPGSEPFHARYDSKGAKTSLFGAY